ncbi:MAG: DUF600 family protein, partial [Candidatus Riflebacteria bacterium]|nr:DUF600 family protein [Candidatus Riflebacteria bacterium]
MNQAIYQTIFDKLQNYLPEKWNKLVFFAGYTDGSYSMKYYIEKGDNKYIDCFNI